VVLRVPSKWIYKCSSPCCSLPRMGNGRLVLEAHELTRCCIQELSRGGTGV
jgi:hypothetical protein